MTVGWVAGRPVLLAALTERLAALRAGPLGRALPGPDGMEGRGLRRFVAQLLLTEELVRAEADRLGVDAPEAHPVPARVDRSGSVTAAVLAYSPLARALATRVSGHVRVDPARARRYFESDPDRWRTPERRVVTYRFGLGPASTAEGETLNVTRRGLPRALAGPVFAAAPGELVGPVRTGTGWHTCRVERVLPARAPGFDEVAEPIVAELTGVERSRYFERWLEGRRRELVTVLSGFEHPGDPRQPDYTHRH